MTRGFFITGTGTEVGKTYVTALLARNLVARGKRVGVYKPDASGCIAKGNQLVPEDAEQLWHAAGKPLTLDAVCPQRFEAPVAPNVAAEMEDQQVDEQLLRAGIEPWLECSDIVLVEGAGGLMSPLSANDYNADLAADLEFPLVIVAANRLGVINDTLQTAITASVWGDAIETAGVILNQAHQPGDDASLATNAAQLRSHLRIPLLGELTWQASDSDAVGQIVDSLLAT